MTKRLTLSKINHSIDRRLIFLIDKEMMNAFEDNNII